MIRHLFKIILAERKINSWIVLELILVFCILWFCTDYTFTLLKRSTEPNYDLKHTYNIQLGMKKDKVNEDEALLQDLQTILSRVKKHPAVEEACLSQSAIPYTNWNWYSTFRVDTLEQSGQEKWVTLGFFKVFGVEILNGKKLSDSSFDERNVVISGNNKDEFAKRPPEQINTITVKNEGTDSLNVIGVAAKTKFIEYENYIAVVYHLLKDDSKQFLGDIIFTRLSIRVKPEADHNFEKQFLKEMRSQLQVGPYYIASISPGIDKKNSSTNAQEYENNLKTIYSITFFLLVNIFLGIIGTFWVRIQSRKSEIGLRIALGATRSGIMKLFLMETFLLIFIASVVSAIICINVGMTDLLQEIGVPIVWREPGTERLMQHLTNYGLTFLILAAVASLAIWYPAKKASQTFPAEALRDE